MAAGVKTGGRKAGTPNAAKPPAAAGGGGAGRAADDALVSPIKRGRPPNPPNPGFPPYRIARVADLVPYANNARTHSPAQVATIAASIREFGFTNPVLVDAKRGIVAGHGRVLAAQQLGMESVPTIELSHLSAAQRRAYVIADNKLAEAAGWDDEMLALELGELRDEGFDLALTGFDVGELAGLFGEDAPASQASAGREAEAAKCPHCGKFIP